MPIRRVRVFCPPWTTCVSDPSSNSSTSSNSTSSTSTRRGTTCQSPLLFHHLATATPEWPCSSRPLTTIAQISLAASPPIPAASRHSPTWLRPLKALSSRTTIPPMSVFPHVPLNSVFHRMPPCTQLVTPEALPLCILHTDIDDSKRCTRFNWYVVLSDTLSLDARHSKVSGAPHHHLPRLCAARAAPRSPAPKNRIVLTSFAA